MNKIYKVIWSKVKNCYVVASELAKSHTKSPASGVLSRTLVAGVLACLLSCGAVFPVYAQTISGQTLNITGDFNPGETITGNGLPGGGLVDQEHIVMADDNTTVLSGYVSALFVYDDANGAISDNLRNTIKDMIGVSSSVTLNNGTLVVDTTNASYITNPLNGSIMYINSEYSNMLNAIKFTRAQNNGKYYWYLSGFTAGNDAAWGNLVTVSGNNGTYTLLGSDSLTVTNSTVSATGNVTASTITSSNSSISANNIKTTSGGIDASTSNLTATNTIESAGAIKAGSLNAGNVKAAAASTIGGALTVSGKISGVSNGTANTDAVNYSQLKPAIKALSVSGKTITYTKIDGTTGTITTQDTDTHYTTHLYAGSGTAANAATTNGNTKITLTDDSTVRNSVTIKGSGATTVTSDASGNITISSTDNNTTYSAATTSAAGLMSAADKSKLDGIASGANAYTLPAATSSALGGVKIGSNITNSSGTISLTKDNVTAALGYTPPTTDTNTHYTSGLYVGSGTKANAATTNGNTKLALYDDNTSRSTITIKGTGATSVTSDANGVITINSTDNNTTYSAATSSAAGLMSAADKSKLDGIASGANAYTLPTASSSTLGGVKVGSNITLSSGTISLTKDNVTSALGYTPPTQDTNTTYSAFTGATSSAAGIAGLVPAPAKGAQNYVLHGDGTWKADANTTYSAFTGATSSAAGTAGLVKAPAAGDQNKFLRGDGTWAVDNDTKYSAATTSAAGLMSAADKAKLDGIASGANAYTLPAATSSALGGVKIGSNITNTDGTISLTKANVTAALGYTPPTQDTNTTYDNMSASELSTGTGTTARSISAKTIADYVTGKVSAETTARTSAVSSEATARANADTALGTRIDGTIKDLSVSGRTITYTKGDGTTGTITTQDNNTTYDNMSATELSTGTATTARSISAKVLGDYVTGKVSAESTARTTAINSEATTRANADTALGTRIDNAITAYESADAGLSNRIGSLSADGNYIKKSATNNVSANLTALDTQLKTTATAVGTETTNRTNADTALSNRIGSVASDGTFIKKSATNDVATNLTALDTAAKNAIKGLSVSGTTITYTKGDGTTGTITTQDNNTTYDNMSASELSTGTATAARSISAKVLSDYVTGKVSAETTARSNAISSEATARSNADTALGTRIDNAVSAYESADTGLSNRIGTLTVDGNYIKKAATKNVSENLSLLDTQLKTTTTALSTETTNRTNADAALGTRIDGTIKGLSVSGKTITYTKGDGSTGTITTQDTTYTAGNGLSLNNGSFSVNTNGAVASGNTGIVTGGTVYDALEARIGQITVQNDAQNTVALGDNSSVSGDGAVAVGSGSSGTGEGSVAVGDTSSSSGEGSVAVGSEASASSEGAIALGSGSSANSGDSNNNAVAIGNNAQAGTDSTPVSDVTAIGGGSTASGDSGTAVGADSTASGTNTTAIGSGTTASGTGASAIGQGSSATGQGSSALGEGSTAGGTGSVAIGSDATASSSGAIALGNDAVANSGTSNSNATAIGNNAQAGSNTTPVTDATAIGGNSTVSGNSGTAVGATSTASGTNTTAVGSGTNASGAGASAIGQGSTATSADATAVGHGASATGTDSVALGSDSQANSSGAVSIGNDAIANSGTSNSNAVAIGNNAHAGTATSSTENSTAIGGSSSVTGASGTALGANTSVSGTNATAIGSSASATGSNSIALGAGSVADTDNTVSVGTSTSQRTISNVAAGTSATDAATVGQTYVLQNGTNTTVADAGTNAIGQHIYQMTVNTDGQVASGNTGIVTGGTVYDALEARIGQITVQNDAQNTVALGDNSSVSGDGAVAVGSGSSGSGEGSVAIGDTSSSSGEGSVAVGTNTTAESDNTVVIGTGSTVTGTSSDNSVAIGQQTSVTGSDSVALGGGSSVTGSDSVALGGGSSITGSSATAVGKDTVVNNDNSVALGSGSNASQDNVVSVGHSATDLDSSGTAYGSDLNRRIVNVADAVDAHDAVTKGQLDTLMADRVGTLATNGNYILKDNTTSANLVSLDTQLKTAVDSISALSNNAVAYQSATKDAVVYAGTNGTVLRNVKGGLVNETSMEAVNGSQLYSVKQDITGFASDIRANASNIDALNSSVTAALSSVSASGLLVDTLDSSKADKSLSNLSDAGKRVLKSYAEDAVATYLAEQGLSIPAAPMAVNNGSVSNGNTLSVTNAGNGSLHVGEGSYVNGTSSIAIGVGNQVNANNSGAFGDPSIINADESYVLGNDDTINTGATGSFIVGNDGISDAKGGLLFGSNTKATVDAENGMALGNNAEVSAKNAIALGSGSIADSENTLSIGNSDLKRKIVNVADGDISQNSSEAVTGAQLFLTNEKVQQNTEAIEKKAELDASNIDVDKWSEKLATGTVEEGNTGLVNGGTVYEAMNGIANAVVNSSLVKTDGENIFIGAEMGGRIVSVMNKEGESRVITGVATNPEDASSAANVGYVNAVGESLLNITNSAFQKVDNKVNKVGASAAALANLPTPTFDGEEKWAFAAGVGHYQGETAAAVGAFYKPTDNVIARVSGSFGNGDEMIGAGVAVSLNKANTPTVSKAQLVRTINEMKVEHKTEINNIKADYEGKIAAQNEEIAQLKVMMADLAAKVK